MNTIAMISLLHESCETNSATRRFRGESVLSWTLRRTAQADRLEKICVLAWDDQLDALAEAAISARACGARQATPVSEATAAAQRWAEGWRGGLGSTCWFDNGFFASHVLSAMDDAQAEAMVWIDPASALVDPALLNDLVSFAAQGEKTFFFSPAAPGLSGVLLKRDLVQQLLQQNALPGKLVHYLPDAPMLDPVTSDSCVSVPLPVSRTPGKFTLDSQRRIQCVEAATEPLNGTLISSDATSVVARISKAEIVGRFPQELVIELTTRRESRPVFCAGTHLPIDRPDLSPSLVEAIVDQVDGQDDLRVTLAGVGDPMSHPEIIAILQRFRPSAAVAVETDLIDVSDDLLKQLAHSNIDVISVNLPAMQPRTYAAVMGVDAMARVVDNIRVLLLHRQQAARGVPLIVPVFQKTAVNLDQMEQWYDTWLRALGNAVIRGPSTFGGKIPDSAAADMSPSVRSACSRINQRLTILSDGSITLCEEDVAGQASLGNLSNDKIADVWAGAMGRVRQQHRSLTALPVLCGNCREWYRP